MLYAVTSLTYASTNYVSLSGAHVFPFDSWDNAATNIQAAIDAASPNNTVLVSNGVYSEGGKLIYGTLTNRIAIDKPITVSSLNGAHFSIIVGQGPMGSNAVRCAYLTNGASLIGFTLTNGHTQILVEGVDGLETEGGGAWCESTNSLIQDCVITANKASNAGGVHSGHIVRSFINGNDAEWGGGGAQGSSVNASRFEGNSAGDHGGGLYQGSASFCIFSNNYGGWSGGGAFAADISNCIFHYNRGGNGAATSFCSIRSSTICFNSGYSGIYFDNVVENCIVWYNEDRDCALSTDVPLNHVCTISPRISPEWDDVIIDAVPQFINATNGDYRLKPDSPCIDAGTNILLSATDFYGNPRLLDGDFDRNPIIDIGAHEYWRTELVVSNELSLLWPSASNFSYTVASSTNLHEEFVCVATNIGGLPPLNEYPIIEGTSKTGFYRIEIEQ